MKKGFGYRPGKSIPAREKFFKRIQKTDGHWIWTGPKTQNGLGKVTEMRNGKTQSFTAPRLSWLIHHGPVQDGFVVLSQCGVRLCVNPEHLGLKANGSRIGAKELAE